MPALKQAQLRTKVCPDPVGPQCPLPACLSSVASPSWFYLLLCSCFFWVFRCVTQFPSFTLISISCNLQYAFTANACMPTFK